MTVMLVYLLSVVAIGAIGEIEVIGVVMKFILSKDPNELEMMEKCFYRKNLPSQMLNILTNAMKKS